jgi:hypothetical protein
VRTHTGEKPYSCTVCNYASATDSALKIHMRTHSDQRPFQCGQCHHRARTKTRLAEHMRIHTETEDAAVDGEIAEIAPVGPSPPVILPASTVAVPAHMLQWASAPVASAPPTAMPTAMPTPTPFAAPVPSAAMQVQPAPSLPPAPAPPPSRPQRTATAAGDAIGEADDVDASSGWYF